MITLFVSLTRPCRGLAQDTAFFAYFQRHYPHYVPGLRTLRRTTFVRQAANLWWQRERVWQDLLDQCRAIRRSRSSTVSHCRRFSGEAAFDQNTLIRQTFYGLQPARPCPSGVARPQYPICVTPANLHELAALTALAERAVGILVGDRHY